MTKSISYSDARANLAKIWDEIIDENTSMELTRSGKESLAILPASEYNAMIESVHLMKSPKNALRILQGIQDAENRKISTRTGGV
jgi:antitoxin YefM